MRSTDTTIGKLVSNHTRIKFLITGIFFVSFSTLIILFWSSPDDVIGFLSRIIFSIFTLFGAFFLLLFHISSPFKITEKGIYYPPPPFPTWSFKNALRYHFIPFSRIERMEVSNPSIPTIEIMLKNGDSIILYPEWSSIEMNLMEEIMNKK